MTPSPSQGASPAPSCAAAALLAAGVRLGGSGPRGSTDHPGRRGAARAGRRPRQARGDDEARSRRSPTSPSPAPDVTISGTGLPANKDVTLTWSTANVDWMLDARPDSVDYLGRKATKFTVLLATAHTDATGAFSVKLAGAARLGRAPRHLRGRRRHAGREGRLPDRPPRDDDAEERARSARRSRSRTPASARRSTRARAALILRQQVRRPVDGELDARASPSRTSAPPARSGKHVIDLDDAVTFSYMNIPQSPIPWATGKKFVFTVTKDAGPAGAADRLADERRRPRCLATTTLNAAKSTAGRYDRRPRRLSVTSGQILTKVDVSAQRAHPERPGRPRSGRPSSATASTAPAPAGRSSTVPLGTATAAADGTLKTKITVPDGLGGWHAVQLDPGRRGRWRRCRSS